MCGPASKAVTLGLLGGLLVACSPERDEAGAVDGSTPPQPIAQTETLPQVRQVLPGRAVHIPDAGTELERVPTPPVAPPPPRPTNLGIIVVEQANRLRTRRGMITLAGTEPIGADTICELNDGRTPACSILARSAVRRFVGRRTVSCTIGLREDAGQDHEAPCLVADIDLGLWIVAQGWAFASTNASPDQRAAETTARAENRGLWAFRAIHARVN